MTAAVRVKRCAQCGAEVQLDAEVFSTSCAFCDSPLIDTDAQTEPVDKVVPFTVPRGRAGSLLASWLAGKWLAPEALRKAARPEELQQIFVPFYAYDALARTRFTSRIGIYWYRTETYTTTVNGKTVVRTRQVRETEWFGLDGSHARRWFDHLVSASRGLPENEANELEPFDLGRALPWGPALTAGVAAELPTVEHAQALQVARAELEQREKQVVAANHLPGSTHKSLRVSTQVEVDAVRLLLLPVWTAVYAGPDDAIRVLVNGQTGEVVGDIPRSKWKVGCLVGAIIATVLIIGFVTVVVVGGVSAISAVMG